MSRKTSTPAPAPLPGPTEEQITARAYELMQADREKHFTAARLEDRPPLPGWSDYLAAARAELTPAAPTPAPAAE